MTRMTGAFRDPLKISFCRLSFRNGVGTLLNVNTSFLASGANSSVTWSFVGAISLSGLYFLKKVLSKALQLLVCLLRKKQVQTNGSTIIRCCYYLSPPFLITQIP